MTFSQVQYFLKVYESGNISLAAQELFLTSSALSKTIRELESEFGCQLFTRTKNGLVPTEAGNLLRMKGLEIVSLMDETGSLMRSATCKAEETIRVGITPTTGITLFPKLYNGFMRVNPTAHILPVEGGKAKAQNMLESGRMDVCFTTYSEIFPDSKGRLQMTGALDSAKLCDTELVFCVHESHPMAGKAAISAEDMRDEPFVFLKKPIQREAEITHRFMKIGADINVIFRASQLAIARQLVQCGMAASIQMRGTLDDGVSIIGIPLCPAATYANVMVWNRSSARKRGVSQFLDFCLNHDYGLLRE